MNAIIRYILNMLPYMVIAVPIYCIVRFAFIKSKNKAVNPFHEAALFIFIIFVTGLASQTVIPKIEITMAGGISIISSGVHTTNLIPFKVLPETYTEAFVHGHINYFIINFVGNIIMFMPIGFFIPLLWDIPDKKVVLTGFCCSFFIEFCQLFLNRGSDVDDLILNTLGVFFGLLVYKLLYRVTKRKILKFR